MNAILLKRWSLVAALLLALAGCAPSGSSSSSDDNGGGGSTSEGSIESPVQLTASTPRDDSFVGPDGTSYYVLLAHHTAASVHISNLGANASMDVYGGNDFVSDHRCGDSSAAAEDIGCLTPGALTDVYIKVDDLTGLGTSFTIEAGSGG
ncbi:MAG TPA: hypothetical protein VF678_16440 [bacterium]